MSDTVSQNTGVGWISNAQVGGPQHEALYGSRPLYQAAGARRAPALDAQHTPSDVYAATHGDTQYAIGIVCAGVTDSFFGDLAAQALGTALAEWVWQHRVTPPVEREVTAYITSQQAALAGQVHAQALNRLQAQGGPADLLRRREQVGSQTTAGFYILALDGSVMFYLLGDLHLFTYSTDLSAAPAEYIGNPGALWSSRNGSTGTPVARTVRPAQGVSLSTANLPADWGRDFKLLYQPASFNAAAAATPATLSVGFAAAMIDPRMGPTTAAAAPQPFVPGTKPADVGRARPGDSPLAAGPMTAVAADPIPFRGSNVAPTRPVPLDDTGDSWDRDLDFGTPGAHDSFDSGLDSLSDIDDAEEAALRPPADTTAVGVGVNRRASGPTVTRSGLLANLPLPTGNTGLLVGAALLVGALVFFCLAWAVLAGPLRPGGGTTTGTVVPSTGGCAGMPAGATCFKETDHYVTGRFKDVWNSDGGLVVFGFPISNPRPQGALQVQDFERFRFEQHPEIKAPYNVLFANLGLQDFQKRGGNPNVPGERNGATNCRWFADVQHNVCGAFLDFWAAHGRNLGPGSNPEQASLALFGTPITEERKETINGKALTVQWFQKARFELHPEMPPGQQVQLGLLGVELAPK